MAERVDLEHAEQEATSLKRYGDVNGFEDLADFAALTLNLAAELRILRNLLADLTAKATPHGPEIDEPGGPYVGAYLLPTGPLHRALAYLRDGAVPSKSDPAAGHADDAEAEIGKQVYGA